MTLVLVDIDGTLIDCRGRVGPLLERALRETYGLCGDISRYEFGGKLDPQIVVDLVCESGADRGAVLAGLDAARRRYLEILCADLDLGAVRLLPHAQSFLATLATMPALTLALLTGNWERGARHKLSAHDLNRYFAFGAFGDDGFERADLPPVALERAAARSGRRSAPSETWVVGDSVQDVACARAHGLRSLAVATGRTAAGRLAAAGAEFVVPDLEAALEILLAEQAA